MHSTSRNFTANASQALADPTLQQAMEMLRVGFPARRAAALAQFPEWEELRNQGVAVKNHTLENLDFYLEKFADQVGANGGQVHWASTAQDARQAILDICQKHGAKKVTKGKSMVAEEIFLNQYLMAAGIEPVETDLGEYIIQLRDEAPSHIIAPAAHLIQAQFEESFRAHHTDRDPARRLDTPQALLAEARSEMRHHFAAADIGITGANFLIAESGATVIVTNEGNGDLTQTLPRVHIVVTSIEKVLPTTEDMAVLLRLLTRSATGQEISVYVSLSNGPRQPGDLDGPEEFHVVLVDNGRSELLGGEFSEILRCIRCAACLNHCPVYQQVGGHSYGWVYPGPMGAVLTPAFIGIEEAGALPNASSFCGRCEEVCPMKIPLPKLMRFWRDRQFVRGVGSAWGRWGVAISAWVMISPLRWGLVKGLARFGLGWMARLRGGKISHLPLAGGWFTQRDLVVSTKPSFWRQRAAAQQKTSKN
ncbi:MAG: LutB/LldF family L-lactate oxidation iron-sulfur protein [Candidatus Symbiobacter sp.]|nr:LutB/LldF family L-lactate oxidation iron-sulfur protein [Candidatus Symbiobacter sp.]